MSVRNIARQIERMQPDAIGVKSPPNKAKYLAAIFRSNGNCGRRTHFGHSALTRTAASKQPFALRLGGCAGLGCGHCAAELVGLAALLS
jgi:hypothetical protein